MNKNSILFTAIVLIIIAAGVGFYAGMQYQGSRTRVNQNQLGSRNFGQFGGANGRNDNVRAERGQVLNVGNNTLTIKLNNGSTEIVVLSASTNYTKSQKASFSDIKTGDTLNVFGTPNSDGSVTASDIQINPAAVLFRGGNSSSSAGSVRGG